jgi:hypothetical protein
MKNVKNILLSWCVSKTQGQSPTMSTNNIIPRIFISCFAFVLINCGEKKESVQQTAFTKQDSLTETYLSLQDSMLLMWNRMVDDDNQKVKAMHGLVHELMISGKGDTEALVSVEQRLEQLQSLRFTQETLANTDRVEEYDFAIASLISEVISIAESRTEFPNDSSLQKLANRIKMADDRVNIYREEYDSVVNEYNTFLVLHQGELKEIDPHSTLQKRAVFGMTSDN